MSQMLSKGNLRLSETIPEDEPPRVSHPEVELVDEDEIKMQRVGSTLLE